jgi:hypothetical protein
MASLATRVSGLVSFGRKQGDPHLGSTGYTMPIVMVASFAVLAASGRFDAADEASRRSGGGGIVQITFIELLLFWVSIWFSNRLFYFTRLASVLWYLALGSVYGNLGILHRPSEAVTFFSEFAITMTFFAMGFEESVPRFLEGVSISWGIAFIGAVAPYGVGFIW